MSANVYECMVLFDSAKYNADAAGVVHSVHAILEKAKAEILASRPWNEQKLAYPIRQHKRGMYYLIYFKAEGTALKDIEREYNLNEAIVRTLTTKVQPKYVDMLLAVARDEHALAVEAPGLREDLPAGPGRGAPVAAAGV